jgi:hypothetical protein
MSKQNKVNPDHYHQAGRMTPDESARERVKIQQVSPRDDEGRHAKPSASGDAPAAPAAAADATARGGPITATARRKAAARR